MAHMDCSHGPTKIGLTLSCVISIIGITSTISTTAHCVSIIWATIFISSHRRQICEREIEIIHTLREKCVVKLISKYNIS